MKKLCCLIIAALMLLALPGCAGKPQSDETGEAAQPEAGWEWTRSGYFTDEDGNFLSVAYMDVGSYAGWYVGCILGEEEASYGSMLLQQGKSLHGTLAPVGDEEEISVTLIEDGKEGLRLAVEGGPVYHFTPIK